jgi:hypothetical protein
MSKKILSIDGFRYKSIDRLNEVKNTLRWNLQFFDEIHIWCQESLDYEAFLDCENEKTILHNLNRTNNISMRELYNFTNSVSSPNDYKFFANSDTTFGKEIKNYSCEDEWFILFTNRAMRNPEIGQTHEAYVKSENDGLMLFNRDGILDPNWFHKEENILRNNSLVAHCGWSWKTIKDMDDSFECYLGTQGGENCFLTQIFNSGFKPKAGVIKYPTFHNHRTDERTERHSIRVNGSFLSPTDIL